VLTIEVKRDRITLLKRDEEKRRAKLSNSRVALRTALRTRSSKRMKKFKRNEKVQKKLKKSIDNQKVL